MRTGTARGPGIPDHRSAGRYVWWLVVSQRGRVAAGATYGSLWMVGLMLPPYVLSRAIDEGLVPGRCRYCSAGWRCCSRSGWRTPGWRSCGIAP